ncbi:MAG: CdaR family protein [Anaerolineales bacterium]|jgi:YbbR domain-containing protein
MLNWMRENVSTLILSFILALTAWVAAVSQEDPLLEQLFPEPIPINYSGLQEGLTIVGAPPETAQVTLRAPESVWRSLNSQDIEITADMSSLDAGIHRVELQWDVTRRATQVTSIDPTIVTLTVEMLSTKQVDVRVQTRGEVASGYRAEQPELDREQVTVTGPASLVSEVTAAEIVIDLNGRQRPVDADFTLRLVDAQDDAVSGLQTDTDTIHVTIGVTKLENLATKLVIPVVVGQDALEAQGYYRITRVNVTPSQVAVFSPDPAALEALPAFVQTMPIDVSQETHSIDQRVDLDLPEGFSLIGEQNVRVQIDIEPVETSITITRNVELENLGFGLYAYPSPESINLILTGPAVTLDELKPADIHVVLDMEGLSLGSYQLEPQVQGVPEGIAYQPPTPNVIEVSVTAVPRPTPTPIPTP